MASLGSGWEVFTRLSSNAGVLQGYILGPTSFLLYINDIPDDVICNIAMYADDDTLYYTCDQASDLRETMELGRKWLVNFNAGKTQLVLFNRSNNTRAIDVKMDGSVLEEKSFFKTLRLTFSSE